MTPGELQARAGTDARLILALRMVETMAGNGVTPSDALTRAARTYAVAEAEALWLDKLLACRRARAILEADATIK